MKMNYPLVIVSVFVASIVLVAMLPTFIGATYTTEERTNNNAGWVRFNYSERTTASIDVTINDSVLSLGGSSPQTGAVTDTMIYADANVSVYLLDGTAYYVGNGTAGALSDTFNISKLTNGVRITDGGNIHNFPASDWAYIPNSTGTYAFFDNGTTVNLTSDYTLATVGQYAGVSAYNDYLSRSDITLDLITDLDDDSISSAEWGAPLMRGVLNPVDPNSKTLNPDEVKTGPLRDTPQTYTDDNGITWTYTYTDRLVLTGASVPVGAPTNITIPNTIEVGGYARNVAYLGDYTNPIFNNSEIAGHTLTLPNTAYDIRSNAFKNCSGFTGSLTIPSNVRYIGSSSFLGCSGFTGSLTIPSNAQISSNAFQDCSGFNDLTINGSFDTYAYYSFWRCTGLTSVILPDDITTINQGTFSGCTSLNSIDFPISLTSIQDGAFYNCSSLDNLVIPAGVTSITGLPFENTGITKILNLSNVEITGNSYGLNNAEVRDNIPALGYIANTTYTVQTLGSGSVYVLIRLIPVFFFIGLLIFITKKLKDRENYE